MIGGALSATADVSTAGFEVIGAAIGWQVLRAARLLGTDTGVVAVGLGGSG